MKMLKREGKFVLALLVTLLVFSGCSKKMGTMHGMSSPSSAKETTEGLMVDNVSTDSGDSGTYEVVSEPLALLDSGIDEEVIEPSDISGADISGDTEGLSGLANNGEKSILIIGLNDVFFEFDMANLLEGEIGILKKNAEWLKANPSVTVRVTGHADERGTSEYNLALGEKRAQIVKKYLLALGINPSRIDIISYGEERGFCAEHNEKCWAQNRRGHFDVMEKQIWGKYQSSQY